MAGITRPGQSRKKYDFFGGEWVKKVCLLLLIFIYLSFFDRFLSDSDLSHIPAQNGREGPRTPRPPSPRVPQAGWHPKIHRGT